LDPELSRDLREIEERIQASSGRRWSPGDVGCIYVLRFSTDIVKVGKAVNPKSRIAHHGLIARVHGVTITESWASGVHRRHSATERQLIDYCKARGKRIAVGAEYFTGVPFEAACDFANQAVGRRLREAGLAA
jgi:hypothetical protein